MNAVEQKTHRTVTKDLSERLDAVEAVTAEIDVRLVGGFNSLDRRINEERTDRLALAQEQRGYVDGEDRKLRTTCQERWDATTQTMRRVSIDLAAFEHLTLWGRLRWLLTGTVTP